MLKPSNAEKYSMSEALQRFSNEEAWDRFAALETECVERGFVSDFLGAPSLNMFLDERNEDDRDRLNLTSKREEALKAIQNPFVKKLIAGTLISDGYIYPVETDDEKLRISPDMWRFLRPQFLNSRAAGSGIRFEGISVWVPDAGSSDEETARGPSNQADVVAERDNEESAPVDSRARPAHRPPILLNNARRALCDLYPNGAPSNLKNLVLVEEVNVWLGKEGLPRVSKDTIIRALKKIPDKI